MLNLFCGDGGYDGLRRAFNSTFISRVPSFEVQKICQKTIALRMPGQTIVADGNVRERGKGKNVAKITYTLRIRARYIFASPMERFADMLLVEFLGNIHSPPHEIASPMQMHAILMMQTAELQRERERTHAKKIAPNKYVR